MTRAGVCRVCGCTEHRACDGGCWWVAPDLCSSCTGRLTPDELAAALPKGRTFKTLPGGRLVDVTDELERARQVRALASDAFGRKAPPAIVNRHARRQASAARRRQGGAS